MKTRRIRRDRMTRAQGLNEAQAASIRPAKRNCRTRALERAGSRLPDGLRYLSNNNNRSLTVSWHISPDSEHQRVQVKAGGRNIMRHTLRTLGIVATAMLGIIAAYAQEPIKIGVILPYSGQFADTAMQLDNGIRLYVKQHDDSVGGRKIEFVRKDVGGIAPDVAKRLAQELVVRDRVDLLAGFVATPNAMAASDVSNQAQKFMVIMNAATSIVITKSRYSVRTSFTIAQVVNSFGAWAAKHGIKKIYTMVSDYGPGH